MNNNFVLAGIAVAVLFMNETFFKFSAGMFFGIFLSTKYDFSPLVKRIEEKINEIYTNKNPSSWQLNLPWPFKN